jgi:hypothetical protein
MEQGGHVRFQESDLDALDRPAGEGNNNMTDVEAEEARSGEEERVYSKVCEVAKTEEASRPVKRVHYREEQQEAAPQPAVRRRKRRERDSSRRARRGEGRRREAGSDGEGVDWLEGTEGEAGETAVLRRMVHKLSVELGREQGRRRVAGPAVLEHGKEAPWLTDLGGLVPLLVAYEEELREARAAQEELEAAVGRDQARLEELLADNTEMAAQLRDIALTGPLDPAELAEVRESARLVLEENRLVRAAEADTRQWAEQVEAEAGRRVGAAEEELADMRQEGARLVVTAAGLQEEVAVLREEARHGREERKKWVSQELHTDAVQECQEAFNELKQSYKRDSAEKEAELAALQKEAAGLRCSLDVSQAAAGQLETDARLNCKMSQKFEELSLALQEKVMALAREKSEVELAAGSLGKELEGVKGEVERVMRLARQERERGRQAGREREEEEQVESGAPAVVSSL